MDVSSSLRNVFLERDKLCGRKQHKLLILDRDVHIANAGQAPVNSGVEACLRKLPRVILWRFINQTRTTERLAWTNDSVELPTTFKVCVQAALACVGRVGWWLVARMGVVGDGAS